jgi:hypothetical protein
VVASGTAPLRRYKDLPCRIEEPVAWYGPIVMNTRDQLERAVTELRDGTFIKHQ